MTRAGFLALTWLYTLNVCKLRVSFLNGKKQKKGKNKVGIRRELLSLAHSHTHTHTNSCKIKDYPQSHFD